MFAATHVTFLPSVLVFLLVEVGVPAGHAGQGVGVGGGGLHHVGVFGGGEVRDEGFPSGYGWRVHRRRVTQVVVLQPGLAVNNSGRSHGLHRPHLPLHCVHPLVLLRLTLGHLLALPGLLLLLGVVPPPVLLALRAGGPRAAPV